MNLLPLPAKREIETATRGGPSVQGVAVTDISTGSVQLQPPKDRPGAEQLEVLAVGVLERNEPEKGDASKWLLLTIYCQPTKTEALRSMQRYESRRGIDKWFPMLKMGMRGTDIRFPRLFVANASTIRRWAILGDPRTLEQRL